MLINSALILLDKQFILAQPDLAGLQRYLSVMQIWTYLALIVLSVSQAQTCQATTMFVSLPGLTLPGNNLICQFVRPKLAWLLQVGMSHF